MGQELVISPWLDADLRKTYDEMLTYMEVFNKSGELCKAAGMRFGYHNHDFEFADANGQTGFDILMKETDPSVKMELDLYWAVKAGKNPIDLFAAHPGRFALWHVKDMDNTEKKFFTEVGNGTIDFKAIFAKAKLSGMKYFYVEQDVCPGPPMDSIAKSIEYMRKNIVK